MTLRLNKCRIRQFDLAEIVFFIAIFGSSIIGAKVGRISINKIAIVPLTIYLIRNGISVRFGKGIRTHLLLLYCTMLFSCAFALARRDMLITKNGYYSTLILYLLQLLVFYMPLCLAMKNKTNIELVNKHFLRAFVIVVRIHCAWAILQEIVYFFAQVSINDLLFLNLLRGLGSQYWTPYVLFDKLYIRASGFNSDPAYFGILLIFGFALDKKPLNRIAYAVLSVLTFSRTTIIGMLIAIGLRIYFDRKKKIRAKTVLEIIFIAFLVALIVFFPNTNELIRKAISRFDFFHFDQSNWSISSFRHFNFYPYSFLVFKRSSIIEKLFGFGPRIDGIAFTLYSDIIAGLALNGTNLTDVWCVESDFVGLLLGCGLCGLCLYYSLLLRMIRNSIQCYKIIVICLLTMGLMYNYYSVTFINLFFIFFVAVAENRGGSGSPACSHNNPINELGFNTNLDHQAVSYRT